MKFVFVTQELDPVVPGGAGALIAGVAAALGRHHDVVVVLAAPGVATVAADPYRVVSVPLEPADGSLRWFVERSRRTAEVLREVTAEGRPDLVEFTDFEALGFWALSHRRELGLETVPLAVRVHGPIGAIAAAVGAAPDPWPAFDVLERVTFAMADIVLAPSTAIADWMAERYGIDPTRVIEAPPIVPTVVRREWVPAETPWIAGFGRLSETKGTDTLVKAMLPLLVEHPSLRLVLIGPDGWSAVEGRAMSAVLHDLIPPALRSRVEMTGSMGREEALDALRSAWAVAMPSRFESFCLAAHEVRRAGYPVVVPELTAFVPFPDDFIVYDGSVEALTATLGAIVTDRASVAALAARPAPEVGDPVAPYLGRLPAVRHPRSQGGLGTIAVKRLEELETPVPVGVPDVSVRHDRVERGIAAGRFSADGEPDVSMVIPCFDGGRWLEGAVLSVFEQTHRSWEVVIVDDGSTDSLTIEILHRLATWPRVRVIRQDNRGLPAARNAGMAAARGRFVVPLDADDELRPRYLEAMLTAIEDHPGAAFAHCWAELFGDIEAVWIARPTNPYWERLGNSVVGCVLLRREAWQAVGGYDESMVGGHEDWELWLRLAAAGWGRVAVPEPLFRYRKRGISMSVHSEADFEAGLARIVDRHRDLYQRGALRALKREWYPAVSLLVGPSVPADSGITTLDVQVVPVAGELAEAVASVRGKYVVDARTGVPEPGVVLGLVDRLERAPERGWDREGAVVMWRRWALVDPDASFLDSGDQPSGDLLPGAFADPEWMANESALALGLRVERYRPEEPARIPEWLPMLTGVAVVATVRNEITTITRLVETLVGGSRAPDQIVITDAGSTDGTWEELQRLAALHPILRPIRVAGNRSRGRNLAIALADHDVIAAIDGGCVPRHEWLEELVAPFAEGAVWVGGFYEAAGPTRRRSIGVTMIFVLSEALRGGFIPSARSVAFTRRVWELVGGFPEHLEVSEDTAFDEALTAAAVPMVFRPRAIVEWMPPAGFGKQFRAVWSWSRSDGVAGIRSFYYVRELRVVLASILIGGGGLLIDPRLLGLGLIPLLALMARQTREKYAAVPGPTRFVWIPVAWSVGFAARVSGFLRGALPRKLRYLWQRGRNAVAWRRRRVIALARRGLRAMLPGAVIDRVRLARQSRSARHNVDLYVGGRREERRWLRTTPDTYRVGRLDRLPADPDFAVLTAGMPAPEEGIVVVTTPHASAADHLLAARLAATGGAGVVGVGGVPDRGDRVRHEPACVPVAVAVDAASRAAIGDVTAGDVAGLVHRLRQAGTRLSMRIVPGTAKPVERAAMSGEVVVVVSAVPMHDVGGGSRGAQITLELLERGYTVAHVALYPADESVDLGLRYLHPRLEQYSYEEFDAVEFSARASVPGIVLLELPEGRAATIGAALQARGWTLIYDLIDDWSHVSLGGGWYDEAIERRIVAEADGVAASAGDLVDRLGAFGRDAVLVPNAVNERLFGGPLPAPPADIADVTGTMLGYHGSLYGDWFDWGALAAVAAARPDATVIVIGDDRAARPPMPPNVRFLGLRPQADLPGYLARLDVGLVPFTVTPVTHAVSPLKVFEYLACGVPVAAPPLRALAGIDGVHTDDDLVRAVEAALRGPRPDRAEALRRHGWGDRVAALFASAGRTLRGVVPPSVQIVSRPAEHYPPRRRRVRGTG